MFTETTHYCHDTSYCSNHTNSALFYDMCVCVLLMLLEDIMQKKQSSTKGKYEEHILHSRWIHLSICISGSAATVEISSMPTYTQYQYISTWWGIIIGYPSTKWHNLITVPFFDTKMSMSKHEIMLHTMTLELPTVLTAYANPDSFGLPGSACHWYINQAVAHVFAVAHAKGWYFEQKLSKYRCCLSTTHFSKIWSTFVCLSEGYTIKSKANCAITNIIHNISTYLSLSDCVLCPTVL